MLADPDIRYVEELPLVIVSGLVTCVWLGCSLARRRRFKEFEQGASKEMRRALLDASGRARRDEQVDRWP
jgi:hypothetical protein